mmetsp:Transcript_53012/g.119210  ORF Transcript_53012/g.119210 Transcript_53012/m.119210 type:complete len:148 (-) Transcript_53012:791-1234(-)
MAAASVEADMQLVVQAAYLRKTLFTRWWISAALEVAAKLQGNHKACLTIKWYWRLTLAVLCQRAAQLETKQCVKKRAKRCRMGRTASKHHDCINVAKEDLAHTWRASTCVLSPLCIPWTPSLCRPLQSFSMYGLSQVVALLKARSEA